MKFPKTDADDKIRPEVRALAERDNVTLDEWLAFRGNSWEQELIMLHLTDEALLQCGRHLVDNCRFDESRPYRSYNEAVMGFLAPELLRRLEAANEREVQARYNGAVDALKEVALRVQPQAEACEDTAARHHQRGDLDGCALETGKAQAYEGVVRLATDLASRPRRV